MEAEAEQLVRELPFGTRVMATIYERPATAVNSLDTIVDRACVERCFFFANYEPSSGQFRVRRSQNYAFGRWRRAGGTTSWAFILDLVAANSGGEACSLVFCST
jgi:hypothetical protein